MWLPSKRSCGGGSAFDSDGNVCTTLTSGDRTTIGAGLGLCALILLVTVGLATGRWYRKSIKARKAQEPMTARAPLITVGRSQSPASFFSPSAPSSPASVTADYLEQEAALSDSSHSHYSQPTSERFHFPLLSADGHLLPPAAASPRRSPEQDNSGFSPHRPLPAPPAA
ncbi:uncharacterized protein LOC62_05G006985 [Vanrija pseudolonga]|uniref:Uncharacterized protein n=1 Tax=Vanrija pseudolonga TaxID=143232 RepID=A0AAF0YCJ6_9TREE|nr:hypothetical protein LOC62_05G006985 [Vanrija pseudolonga]